MAQLTGDAVGGNMGKSILSMISGGVGYIFMGSSHLITILKSMAEKNTMKNAVNTLTQGGNVGTAQRLQQVLTDANVQQTELTAMRLSVEDYTAFIREASYRGVLYAGDLGLDDGAVLFPQYQAAQVRSILQDLGLKSLEETTSTKDVNKVVKAMEALDVKENPELEKYAKLGDERSEPVPIDQFDFGKAEEKGKIFVYDLDATGMPKEGSGNPMTGKTFERGDIFYLNGKIDAKTGKIVSGIRFQYNGEKFIKCAAMPSDSTGVLKDTIKFYAPEQYAALKSLKGDEYRKALYGLIRSQHPNNFNRKEKAGQTESELREIMLKSDASTFRSILPQNLTAEDIYIAARNDIRGCVIYTPWERFPNLKPFGPKSASRPIKADFDNNVIGRDGSIEALLIKELKNNPTFYKELPSDIAANPLVIETAITADFRNWQHVPDSVVQSMTGINKNSDLADVYKGMVEKYLTVMPSKSEYVTFDNEGLPRPNIAFLEEVPTPFLQLIGKDDLLIMARITGQKCDEKIKAGTNLFVPAKTSYAEEAVQAVEKVFSQRVKNEAVINKQHFKMPKPIKHAKQPKQNTGAEQVKQAAKEAVRGREK